MLQNKICHILNGVQNSHNSIKSNYLFDKYCQRRYSNKEIFAQDVAKEFKFSGSGKTILCLFLSNRFLFYSPGCSQIHKCPTQTSKHWDYKNMPAHLALKVTFAMFQGFIVIVSMSVDNNYDSVTQMHLILYT